MMRYAICNETFQNWDWAATCQKVAELGYDGIEVAPFTLTEDVRAVSARKRVEFAQIAARAGLEVAGLHWLLVSPKGLSLTSREESARAETAAYLTALVDFCADLGGHIMVLGSPMQRRIPEGDTGEQAEERLMGCLEPALGRAGQRSVTICLEPLPPPEADFILTLEQAAALVNRIGHPQLGTIFDVKSASSEGISLPELIHRYRALIRHVHANDANRRGPGFGETDYAPVLKALQESGYSGYISVEVFDYSPDPVTIARESLAYMRRRETGQAASL